MKFGVREICNVVLKTKAARKIGSKQFYANEPVLYFDTLKTSTMEGAVTTVYAQGGRGNARLVAWDGERTVTFTMEDALISAEGLSILIGAGLIDASEKAEGLKVHVTETIDAKASVKSGADTTTARVDAENGKILVSQLPYMPTGAAESFAYVMLVKNGEIISEPYLPTPADTFTPIVDQNTKEKYYEITIADVTTEGEVNPAHTGDKQYEVKNALSAADFDSVIVDYYTVKNSGVKQIEITPEMISGNFYLEAETLFRNQDGMDLPAIFIIPNCKVQSNFNFQMAASGDPSTFTFTMDAFPDYTRFDHSQKVFADIQIIEDSVTENAYRIATDANDLLAYTEKA